QKQSDKLYQRKPRSSKCDYKIRQGHIDFPTPIQLFHLNETAKGRTQKPSYL
ncbi:hypothetical protein J6590_093689, partial [Homalodisca vitripennis]